MTENLQVPAIIENLVQLLASSRKGTSAHANALKTLTDIQTYLEKSIQQYG